MGVVWQLQEFDDFLQILSVTASLIGTVLSVYLALQAYSDYRAMRPHNGVGRVMTWWSVRATAMVVMVQVGLAIMAGISWAMPPIEHGSMPELMVAAILVRNGLRVTITIVLMIGSVLGYRDRQRAMALLREHGS